MVLFSHADHMSCQRSRVVCRFERLHRSSITGTEIQRHRCNITKTNSLSIGAAVKVDFIPAYLAAINTTDGSTNCTTLTTTDVVTECAADR